MDMTDLAHLQASIRPFFHLRFGISLFFSSNVEFSSSFLFAGWEGVDEAEWVWLGLDTGWMDLCVSEADGNFSFTLLPFPLHLS